VIFPIYNAISSLKKVTFSRSILTLVQNTCLIKV